MALFGFAPGSFGGRFGQLFTSKWIKPEADVAQDLRVQKQALQVLDNNDGAQLIDNSYYHSPTLAIESSYQTTAALVNEYRAMGLDLDVDAAVDDIVNAAITADEDEPCISIDLERVEGISQATKDEIIEQFNYILELMEMEESAYEKFKSWYTDGRQYYQIVVDEARQNEGIQKLVLLDPRAMKKIKEVTKEVDPVSKIDVVKTVEDYYLYNPAWGIDNTGANSVGAPGNASPTALTGKIGATQVLKIPPEMIAYVHSGIVSPDGGVVFSNLEKARKPLNNLKMMRDALVIYRITRAPERRVFYVDVGSLPRKAAAEYVMDYMNKNKTKVSYDPTSGKVNGHAYQQTMLEDFWMPRREGGRGTEIDTLEGGQNLGQIEDVLYFQEVMYRSLNVPISHLQNDGASQLFGGGHGAEITRDEWKFNKFIQRLRRRYSGVFKDILRVQLSLKGICTKQEWDETIVNKIKFVYASDSYIKNQEENQDMINKLGALAQADQFVGKYYSRDWVKRNVAKQDDEEIATQKALMEKEAKEDLKNEVVRQDALGPQDPNGDEPQGGVKPNPFDRQGGGSKDAEGGDKGPSSGTGAIQPAKPSGVPKNT